jgi:hypothetical protein
MISYSNAFRSGPPRQRPAPGEGKLHEGMVPLHRLSTIYCSTGACREVEGWPMDAPQEGWLQLDPLAQAGVPVELFSFSSRGVGIILPAEVPLEQGAHALRLASPPPPGSGPAACWAAI